MHLPRLTALLAALPLLGALAQPTLPSKDAIDAEAQRTGGTPRTIEGPLYVAGAPETEGFARMDDGQHTEAEPMWLTGQVRDVDGTPITEAQGRAIVKDRYQIDPRRRDHVRHHRMRVRRKQAAGQESQESPSAPTSRPANTHPTSQHVA